MEEFRKISKNITDILSKETRKNEGIFFTPKNIRECLLHKGDLFNGIKVLEPSAGSCEFVQDILSLEPSARITAIEKNPEIVSVAKNIFEPLIQGDFLLFDESETFDLIIGNPTYVQVKQDKQVWREIYGSLLGGKFDVYILFILKSLKLLRPRGILKFILPTAFLSTFSYNCVREYLVKNFRITDLFIEKDSVSWNDTKQIVVGITIVNSPPIDTSFCLIRDPFYFNSEITSIARLNQLTDGKVCFRETGVDIKTGEIVWGPKFTGNTSSSDPILIRNSFISCNGTLTIPNKPRQQLRISAPSKYIINEPVILVNRGNGNNGNLNICLF